MAFSFGAKIPTGSRMVVITTQKVDTAVYTVTSGRRFHPESVIVTNLSAQSRFYLFDATSSVSTKRLDILVKAQTTVAIKEDELRGGQVGDYISGVVGAAEDTDGLLVRVGGYEY